MFVTDADGLIVGDFTPAVRRVGTDGTAAAAPADDALAGVKTIDGDGDIVIRAAGALQLAANSATGDDNGVGLSAHGDGDILLHASGNSGNLDLSAGVVSALGNITLTASKAVSLSAGGDLTTQGSGKTIDVLAGAGVAMADGSLLSATDGNVRVQAQSGDVTLGEIVAGTGVVAVLASGSVLDLGTDTSVQDITAGKLIVTAGAAIGASGNHLETSVGVLTTKSTTGSTYVTEADAVLVDEVSLSINRVDGQGAVSAFGSAANTALEQKDAVSGADLVLSVVNGTLETKAGKGEVVATGNVLLQTLETAETTDAAMTLHALVKSTGGNISLNAADGISLSAGGDLTTQGSGKTIDVLAGAGVAMADGSLLSTANGNVRVQAQAGDVNFVWQEHGGVYDTRPRRMHSSMRMRVGMFRSVWSASESGSH